MEVEYCDNYKEAVYLINKRLVNSTFSFCPKEREIEMVNPKNVLMMFLFKETYGTEERIIIKVLYKNHDERFYLYKLDKERFNLRYQTYRLRDHQWCSWYNAPIEQGPEKDQFFRTIPDNAYSIVINKYQILIISAPPLPAGNIVVS
ncbi:MAG: hypothetical protein PHX34_00590 [Candidatus Shapirobacteria bacterium]|nr:hypothetical protein [Candidatus Shapirobacteria bacterium]